jgi:hypothetical protein
MARHKLTPENSGPKHAERLGLRDTALALGRAAGRIAIAANYPERTSRRGDFTVATTLLGENPVRPNPVLTPPIRIDNPEPTYSASLPPRHAQHLAQLMAGTVAREAAQEGPAAVVRTLPVGALNVYTGQEPTTLTSLPDLAPSAYMPAHHVRLGDRQRVLLGIEPAERIAPLVGRYTAPYN